MMRDYFIYDWCWKQRFPCNAKTHAALLMRNKSHRRKVGLKRSAAYLWAHRVMSNIAREIML